MKEEIISELAKHLPLKKEEIGHILEVPQDTSFGDYAFPCFSLARILKKSPSDIASFLAAKIRSNKIEKVEAVGSYVNFFVNRILLAKVTLQNIIKKREDYGSKKIKEKAIIEFPSPNTNKPLHIGHARNIVLGQSMVNILKFMGNKVVVVNLNNDRGVHICKSMLAFDMFGKGESPKKARRKPDHFVGDYYVRFAKEAEKNPLLEKEAQGYLQRWEAGDKKVVALWKKMNKWSLNGFKDTYRKFGLKFDKEYFESDIYESGKKIIQEGIRKNIFKKKEDGAVYADLNKFGLEEKILLRSDGTSIYITQDIYLAYLKQKEFKAAKSIIISANEQVYHFKVLFKILELLGNKWAKKSYHLNYGMVNLESGRLKSREGNVIDSDELIAELNSLAFEELSRRYKDLSSAEKKDRANKIAMAALRYYYFKTDRNRNITFKPEESISFEGDTGPYLLYTYARACSILNKAKYKAINKMSINFMEDIEKKLVLQLGIFPQVVLNAYEQYAPNLVANYAFQIAQLFNEFYHTNKVIGSQNEQFKLLLVDSFSQVLKNSLYLLNIQVLKKM